jgi:ABC-2 type transport system permease protein
MTPGPPMPSPSPTGASGESSDAVPAAAPTSRRVLAQASAEVRSLMRDGEQLLLTVVLPALALVVLGRTSLVDAGRDPMATVTPGVLALAIMSTSFTSQAISTAFDRESGVLRLMATTPLGRSGLVAGKVVAVAAVETAQLLGLGAVAVALGWRPELTVAVVLAALLGTTAFVALALSMAGTMRAGAVLVGANLIWAVLVIGGGILLPSDRLPGALAEIAPLLPSGALGDAMRATTAGDAFPLGPMIVLAVWATIAITAAVRTFRWSS